MTCGGREKRTFIAPRTEETAIKSLVLPDDGRVVFGFCSGSLKVLNALCFWTLSIGWCLKNKQNWVKNTPGFKFEPLVTSL
jgi:hypothetical protein